MAAPVGTVPRSRSLPPGVPELPYGFDFSKTWHPPTGGGGNPLSDLMAVARYLGPDRGVSAPQPVGGSQAHDLSAIDRLLNVVTLGEHEHPGDLKRYGIDTAKSFDPRSPEGLVNWAGLILTGRGHPEAEAVMPSGNVMVRAKAGEDYATYMGEQGWVRARRRGLMTKMPPPSKGRGVNMTYNLLDPNGNALGSVRFNVNKRRAFVDEIYLVPEARNYQNFHDLIKPILNTGLPIQAEIVNQKLLHIAQRMRARGMDIDPGVPSTLPFGGG